MFSNQLTTSKICGMSTDEDCFAMGAYKNRNGNVNRDLNLSSAHYKLRLTDGMLVAISGAPINDYLNCGNTESLSHVIAAVDVDINGDKGPNVFGKDLFLFILQNMVLFLMEHQMIHHSLFQIVKQWEQVVLLGL